MFDIYAKFFIIVVNRYRNLKITCQNFQPYSLFMYKDKMIIQSTWLYA